MASPLNATERRVRQLLRDAGEDGVSVDELVHLTGETRPLVRAALRTLSRSGEALRLDRNLFVAASANGEFQGVLRYVSHARAWSVATDQLDVAVFEDGLAGAVPGDVVAGTLVSGGGQPVGVVGRVVERGPREFEVELRRFRGAWLGANAELGEPVYLPHVAERARPGERVRVHVEGRTRWKRGKGGPFPAMCLTARSDADAPASSRDSDHAGAAPARGVRVDAISSRIDPRERNVSALLDQLVDALEVPREFPPEVMAEAAAVLDPDAIVDDDLTPIAFCTIDGVTAKDFDDAVFAEARGEDILLHVAVADVSAYVERGSALDEEARRRACSVYIPGRVYPMLPHHLSDGVCSLRPNVLRRCAWVRVRVCPKGELHDIEAGFGTMRSRARLTYRDVQDYLDGREDAVPAEVRASVDELERLRARLNAKRKRRGMLDLDIPEVSAEISDDGSRVTRLIAHPRWTAHRLIEECMLAANEAIARFLKERNWPAIHRVHGKPDPARVASFVDVAKHVQSGIHVGDLENPSELNAVLSALEGTEKGRALSGLLLRSLPRAEYSTEASGHFGLGTMHYLHFTSPIRRYPDLEVHRVLRAALERDDALPPPERAALVTELSQSASSSNAGERFATDCERWADRILRALVMVDQVGERFEGSVTSVVRFGLFVTIDEPYVDGLVPLGRLGNEYFEVDERRMIIRGRRTNTTFRIGDALPVICDEVKVNEGKVSFVPENASGGMALAGFGKDHVLSNLGRGGPRRDGAGRGAGGRGGPNRGKGSSGKRGKSGKRGPGAGKGRSTRIKKRR